MKHIFPFLLYKYGHNLKSVHFQCFTSKKLIYIQLEFQKEVNFGFHVNLQTVSGLFFIPSLSYTPLFSELYYPVNYIFYILGKRNMYFFTGLSVAEFNSTV